MDKILVSFILLLFYHSLVFANQCVPIQDDAWAQIENAKALASATCENHRKKCEEKFKSNEDIKKYLKQCNQPDPESPVLSHIGQCLMLFPQPLIHSFMEIIKLVVATKDKNVNSLNEAIALCKSNDSIRDFMIKSTPMLKRVDNKIPSEEMCSMIVLEFKDWAQQQKIDEQMASVWNRLPVDAKNGSAAHAQLTYSDNVRKRASPQGNIQK